MRKLLSSELTELALARLRRLVSTWNGSILTMSMDAFEALAWRRGYSWATFSNAGLGVHFRRRLVLVALPLGMHKLPEVIHETGHVFASRVGPDDSNEYDFLGWEMAVARAIGLSLMQWRDGNRDYILWTRSGLAGEGLETPPWPSEIGACTDADLRRLYADRLAWAKVKRLVNVRGRPLSVRSSV